MAEALDFRHPDQPSLESSLHAPPGSELESLIEDLNPNQVSLTEVIQSHFRFNPGRYRLIVKKNLFCNVSIPWVNYYSCLYPHIVFDVISRSTTDSII